ncbi:hypothetical protein CIT31_16490 [Mesorhizobium wenxiniae]|uniref:Response regulatory domain-containing protein n=1 Tax=Mesorhizobium wenxiniae TaxID=2014805 RepID=A0A271KG61_9HYPH|nr:hypothetical protein CIT31_16490 [Mesorhizobium wenxiniae]
MIVIEYRDVTQRGWLCGGLRAKLQSCARQILALVKPDVVILDVLLQDCISSSVAEELVARNIPFLIYSAIRDEPRCAPA